MTKLREFMTTKVVTIKQDSYVIEAAKVMEKHHISCVMVVNYNNKLCGIITERDLVHKVVSKGLDPSKTRVDKIMTRHIIHGDPSMTIVKAATIMQQHHIKRIPIIDNGKLVGIVSQTDLLKILSYKI